MTVTIKCDGCGSSALLPRGVDQTSEIKPCTITCEAPAPFGIKKLERDLCRDCCSRVASAADPRSWAQESALDIIRKGRDA